MSSNIGSALAVKQCFSVEPQKFLDGLQKIGVTNPLGVNLVGEGTPQVYTSVGEGAWSGLSLTQMAIGYEVTQTPLQTLALYSAVANNGVMMKPVFVTETRRKGETVSEFGPQVVNDKICSSKTLDACKKMMESACIPGGEGTASNIFKTSPYTVAGKTGTTNDNTNAWFIGFSPDLVAGVYVGYDIPRPLGKRETGSTAAVPIFKQFIMDALEDKPLIPFRRPGGITLVPLHAETGERVLPDHEMAVMEVFKPGQRPKSTIVIDIPGAESPSAVDAPALY